jgi:hypothetical protein
MKSGAAKGSGVYLISTPNEGEYSAFGVDNQDTEVRFSEWAKYVSVL